MSRIVTSATPDAGALNAFNVVIVSRAVSSGNYQNAGATAWNSISAPMIVMSGYTLRNSRMVFTTGGTIPDTAGPIRLEVLEAFAPGVFGNRSGHRQCDVERSISSISTSVIVLCEL